MATVLTMSASFSSQVVIAKVFGAAWDLDAYLTAGALPLSFTGLIMAAIGYVTIPMLSAAPAGLPRKRLAGELLGITLAAGIAIAALGAALGSSLLRVVAPGLPPVKFQLAAHLAPYLWISTGLLIVSSYLISLHHLDRRFVLPTLSGAVVFLSQIAAALLLAKRDGVTSLAAGYLAGAALQTLLLIPILRHSALPALAGCWGAGARFLRAGLPVLGSILPFTLLSVIDAFWASRLPDGSLACLGYASRIVVAITAITVQGLGIVIFPALTDHAAAGRLEPVREHLRKALKFILVAQIPILALLIPLRVPVIALLLERGSFDHAATLRLSAVLPFYLLGMLGMAAMNILVRGFYAISRPILPALLGLGGLGIYAALAGVLSRFFSYPGIGIAYAIYWTLLSLASAGVLAWRLGPWWRARDFVPIGEILLAAVLGATVAAALQNRFGSGNIQRIVVCGTAGATACVLLMLTVSRGRDWHSIASGLEPVRKRWFG